MSREIKFRALTHANNAMVFGDSINTPEGTHRILWFELKGEIPLDVDYNSFNELVQSSTIGQFSGLKDINGKEVFEGDIIVGYEAKNDGGLEKSKFKVVYEDFAFVCISLEDKCDTWLEFFDNNPNATPQASCEVIGNIYQNPELLK